MEYGERLCEEVLKDGTYIACELAHFLVYTANTFGFYDNAVLFEIRFNKFCAGVNLSKIVAQCFMPDQFLGQGYNFFG